MGEHVPYWEADTEQFGCSCGWKSGFWESWRSGAVDLGAHITEVNRVNESED